MAGVGRISLLIDSPLRTVNLAFRGLDAEVRKQITSHTKRLAQPVWQEETRGRALSRLQQRVLAGTSRVGVSGLSMTLRAGGGGRLSSGTPTGLLARAVEHGVNPGKQVKVTNRKGTTFTRRMGTRFNSNRRSGWVVYPSVKAIIPRMASLIVQTTIRTVHEVREKVSS